MSNENLNDLEKATKEFWAQPDIKEQLKKGEKLFLSWDRGRVLFKQLFGDVHVEIPKDKTDLKIKLSEVKVAPKGREYELTVDVASLAGQLNGKGLPIPDNSIRLQARVANKTDGVGIKIENAELKGQNALAGAAVWTLKNLIGLAGYDVDKIITENVVGASDSQMQVGLSSFLEDGIQKKAIGPMLTLEEMGVILIWKTEENTLPVRPETVKDVVKYSGELENKMDIEAWRCPQKEKVDLDVAVRNYNLNTKARNEDVAVRPVLEVMEKSGILAKMRKDLEEGILEKTGFDESDYLRRTFAEVLFFDASGAALGDVLRPMFRHMTELVVNKNRDMSKGEFIGEFAVAFLEKDQKSNEVKNGIEPWKCPKRVEAEFKKAVDKVNKITFSDLENTEAEELLRVFGEVGLVDRIWKDISQGLLMNEKYVVSDDFNEYLYLDDLVGQEMLRLVNKWNFRRVREVLFYVTNMAVRIQKVGEEKAGSSMKNNIYYNFLAKMKEKGRMDGKENMTQHFLDDNRVPLGVPHIDEVIAIKIDKKKGDMLSHYEAHWKALTRSESGWRPYVTALDKARSQVDVQRDFDRAVKQFQRVLVESGADPQIAGEHAKLVAMALKMEKEWPDNRIVKLLKLVVLPVEFTK